MILSQGSADMVIEWLRSNFESNAEKVIEKEKFWHSYRSFHGNVEEDRSIFFSLLGQSFSLAGIKICLIKRKGRTFGYKGLAFKSENPSPSDHLLSPNGVKTWISHNYVEGSAEDVINKMELWNHYKEDNGVAEECRDQFFSQLGQYVFSAEPFRKVH